MYIPDHGGWEILSRIPGNGGKSLPGAIRSHTGSSLTKRPGSSALRGCRIFQISDGYNFDEGWEDGLASRREKMIMDQATQKDADGDTVFPDIRILSIELKKQAGFGKAGRSTIPGL